MLETIHQFIEDSSQRHPNNIAIWFKDKQINYQQLWQQCQQTAERFAELGLQSGERVAIYLPKCPEAVFSFFGATLCGACFVPINAVLKAPQVVHILEDSGSRFLITSSQRLKGLQHELSECEHLERTICIDEAFFNQTKELSNTVLPLTSASDLAAILYTSGSTGKPKGVMLTHNNLVVGAQSVCRYLEMTSDDRILALLPFSFDYGLSQLTCSLSVSAGVVLFDYLLPNDVVKAVNKYQITGLAAVPPLWQQLSHLEWPQAATQSMRYFTNSGGALAPATLNKLRQIWPQAKPFLMYGLTEAFRSSYLPADKIDEFPTSMGIAIPNAELYILRPDGTQCDVDEAGELVHLGALVSPGYWRNPEKTQKRFKAVAIAGGKIGVWSGDQVVRNQQGYMFFVSRMDEMIKTSGYRVSPGEIEAELLTHPDIQDVVVISAKHPQLGEAIIALVTVNNKNQVALDVSNLRRYAMQRLANFMLPQHIEIVATIATNANGKFDRALLKQQYQNQFIQRHTETPLVSPSEENK